MSFTSLPAAVVSTACTIYPAELALEFWFDCKREKKNQAGLHLNRCSGTVQLGVGGRCAHVWTWRDVISQNLRDEISSKRGCGLRNNVNIKDLARSAARHTARTADQNTSACSKSFLKAAFDFFFSRFSRSPTPTRPEQHSTTKKRKPCMRTDRARSKVDTRRCECV